MLTTVITLKNANFEGKGLPNLFPFAAKASLDFAYDFSAGSNRFIDISGNYTAPAEVYKNDAAAGIANQKDSSGLVELPSGKGFRVEHGYVRLPVPTKAINLANDEFTIMVKMAASSKAFPPSKVAVAPPMYANFMDLGSNVSTVGISLDYRYDAKAIGARVNNGSLNLTDSSTTNIGAPVILFISYKAGIWTTYNSVTNITTTKTNSELGLSAVTNIVPSSNSLPRIILGGSAHAYSTLSSGFVDIYQAARWSRKLTDSEVAQQLINNM